MNRKKYDCQQGGMGAAGGEKIEPESAERVGGSTGRSLFARRVRRQSSYSYQGQNVRFEIEISSHVKSKKNKTKNKMQ